LAANKNDYMLGSPSIAWLFILPIAIACVSWTVTHEEVFREPRDYCLRRYAGSKLFLTRKFFYLFTCEYCFSHYVTIFFLWLTRYHVLLNDWRGYIIAFFSLVWIANIYMGVFALIRVDLKKERKRIGLMDRNP
jgi:hypothetical protein